jgi:hypothetical protein
VAEEKSALVPATAVVWLSDNPDQTRVSDQDSLFGPVFELCNPAGVLPKLNVMTVHHFLRPFSRGVVILAV